MEEAHDMFMLCKSGHPCPENRCRDHTRSAMKLCLNTPERFLRACDLRRHSLATSPEKGSPALQSESKTTKNLVQIRDEGADGKTKGIGG